MSKIFYTPPGYSGTAELTASNGLIIDNFGIWKFSQAGYNDGATFGLTLSSPRPLDGEELQLSAENWNIAVVGNTLTEYYDPNTGQTYTADQCRIQVIGQWVVIRQVNSNSWNSIGVNYTGLTSTDQGDRSMNPYLLNLSTVPVSYVIQGPDVTGGAQDTFSSHRFYCRITETAAGVNSNKEFTSNTIARPVWIYSYAKSWEITV
jgi:hypothetical protein